MEFDELVEHLDDLIALAENEGFRFAARLLTAAHQGIVTHQRIEVQEQAELEAKRRSDADGAVDSRFPRNVRDS